MDDCEKIITALAAGIVGLFGWLMKSKAAHMADVRDMGKATSAMRGERYQESSRTSIDAHRRALKRQLEALDVERNADRTDEVTQFGAGRG